ncbi:MAG: XisH protein [Bacteroidota bacterium]|jgi:hypothetical protein
MARDIYHSNVRNALVKDGWKITHDPYMIILFCPQSLVFIKLI